MENYAYEYAVRKGYDKSTCFPHYRNDTSGDVPNYTIGTTGEILTKMHMRDLFEQVAGTSTGSILSAALSLYKNSTSDDPKYFATDAQQIYIKEGSNIFKNNGLAFGF